jgi:hypothetical protein
MGPVKINDADILVMKSDRSGESFLGGAAVYRCDNPFAYEFGFSR